MKLLAHGGRILRRRLAGVNVAVAAMIFIPFVIAAGFIADRNAPPRGVPARAGMLAQADLHPSPTDIG